MTTKGNVFIGVKIPIEEEVVWEYDGILHAEDCSNRAKPTYGNFCEFCGEQVKRPRVLSTNVDKLRGMNVGNLRVEGDVAYFGFWGQDGWLELEKYAATEMLDSVISALVRVYDNQTVDDILESFGAHAV